MLPLQLVSDQPKVMLRPASLLLATVHSSWAFLPLGSWMGKRPKFL